MRDFLTSKLASDLGEFFSFEDKPRLKHAREGKMGGIKNLMVKKLLLRCLFITRYSLLKPVTNSHSL